jgi:hypothetical protein
MLISKKDCSYHRIQRGGRQEESELRRQFNAIKEGGVAEARIRNVKAGKIARGGEEAMLSDTRILEKDDEAKSEQGCNWYIFTSLFSISARGLLSKIALFKDYAANENLDSIQIAESFLNHDIKEAELAIHGDNCSRKDEGRLR